MIYSNNEIAVISTLKNLAQGLNADFAGGALRFVRDLNEFEINFYPAVSSGVRGNVVRVPARFELKTSLSVPTPTFKIRQNTRFDWLSEDIFHKHDFKTGDDEFDDQNKIEIADAEWSSRFFCNSETKSCVSDILKNGFHRIYSEESTLVTDLFVKTTDECPSREQIEKVVKNITTLLTILPTDYKCPENIDQNVANYSFNDMAIDIKEANKELLYGNMDEKSKKRALLLALVLILVLAVAVWHLFTNINPVLHTH